MTEELAASAQKTVGGWGGRNMAQALSQEEFQRMQVQLVGEKTTGMDY